MKKILCALSMATALVVQAQQGQQSPQDIAAALNAFGALMNGGTNATPTVDFRDLKALLPTQMAGMKRTSASGEKQSNFGINVSIAEGDYSDDNEKSGSVKITDFGGNSTIMAGLQFGWANAEIDKETDTGFERTTVVGGHKAMEKYDTESKFGSIEILVNKRFMVNLEGSGITSEELKSAAMKMDLAKLATLQPKAAPAK